MRRSTCLVARWAFIVADAMEFGGIMADHIVPHYRLLFESYEKAQNVQKTGRETKLERQTVKAPK